MPLAFVRSVRAVGLSVLITGALAPLVGCHDPKAAKDAEMKERLEGTWTYAFRDVYERNASGVLTLKADGKFVSNLTIDHEATRVMERTEGEWYVTDGLYKQKATELEGRKLGTLQTLFFTCRISQLEGKSFTCTDDVGNHSFIYRRTAS